MATGEQISQEDLGGTTIHSRRTGQIDRRVLATLEYLAESGFDPLSRTCRFMLTEEAHHMFVGETGVGRAIEATCTAMKAAGIEDPSAVDKVRDLGVIDLPTMQKKLNLHYTLSLDLFGSEVSTNAANSFNASLKGRFQETKIVDMVKPVTKYAVMVTSVSELREELAKALEDKPEPPAWWAKKNKTGGRPTA